MKTKKKKHKNKNTTILNSNKIIKFTIIIFISMFFFTYGFFMWSQKIIPYEQVKAIYYFGIKQLMFFKPGSDQTKFDGFKVCDLPILRKVPDGSIAVIGHAYGSPSRNSNPDDYLAQNVEKFLMNNSNKINKVIFSGDIFAYPSISKWEKLDKNSKSKYEIYIAPGNHDVLAHSAEYAFSQSKFGKINYPYLIEHSKSTIILENSVKTNWNVSAETIKKINNVKKNHPLLVVRHNIPIKELKSFANSDMGVSENFLSYFELEKKLNKKSNITWIIGDSGGFSSLPRLKCLSRDNHRFILNGIGQVIGDRIILISDNKLFVYIL